MQIERLWGAGHFGHLDHDIPFPPRAEDSPDGAEPSVTIIHGRNGVGKTRLLRMLHGCMTLDFKPFRDVPFRHAELVFNTRDVLSVERQADESYPPLRVKFQDLDVTL